MLELIIIISLAIIFFIFLRRMPEVERIEQSLGRKTPLFKGELNHIFDFLKRLRINRLKLRPKEYNQKGTPPQETDSNYMYAMAEKKFRAGDLDGAEKIYLKLAVMEPKKASIYASLGQIYYQKKNYQDAISAYKAAINRDPKNGFYYYELGMSLYKATRYKEAIIVLEKSILINNNVPIRHLGLGLIFMKVGDFQKAAAAFRRALAIEPHNEKYRKLLNKVIARSGRPILK